MSYVGYMSIFMNRLKHLFFVSKKSEVFLLIYKDGKADYKDERIEREIFKKYAKQPILKVKDSLLELEKDFIDLKDMELKDREIEIKKEIEELLIKPIIVSIVAVDRFEKKMKNIRPIKNTWYDC